MADGYEPQTKAARRASDTEHDDIGDVQRAAIFLPISETLPIALLSSHNL
jgi:hypothetical protein